MKIEDIKKKLDYINYGVKANQDIYKRYDFVNNIFTKQYPMSSLVKEEFESIKNIVEKNSKNTYMGTISNGAHSIDYSKIFGFNITKSWRIAPVMFVFENPSNNIDASFIKDAKSAKKLKDKDIDEQLKNLQCDRVWHADYGIDAYKNKEKDDIYGNGRFTHFEHYKMYSQLLLSIILEFKLANFYTCNMFRYEIFEYKKKEKYLNLFEVNDLLGNERDVAFNFDSEKCSFARELKILKPRIIFATYKPHNFLIDYCDENDIVLVKVPHPTQRLTNRERFFRNFTRITLGLYEAGIISAKTRNEKITKSISRLKKI